MNSEQEMLTKYQQTVEIKIKKLIFKPIYVIFTFYVLRILYYSDYIRGALQSRSFIILCTFVYFRQNSGRKLLLTIANLLLTYRFYKAIIFSNNLFVCFHILTLSLNNFALPVLFNFYLLAFTAYL